MKLENKVAVITGGNSGIGLATARRFAEEGAAVILFGRDSKTLKEAGRSIGGATLEEIAAVITSLIPLRRRGTPEEMAGAMLYLASDDSSYLLGAELLVDGGLTQIVAG